jgi:hypothetical protein
MNRCVCGHRFDAHIWGLCLWVRDCHCRGYEDVKAVQDCPSDEPLSELDTATKSLPYHHLPRASAAMAHEDPLEPRTLEEIDRTLREAGYDPVTVRERFRAVAAKAIEETKAKRHAETLDDDGQKFQVWIAACDHLAQMSNTALADWIEAHVWTQFPITAPMSDVLSEVINRLRALPGKETP